MQGKVLATWMKKLQDEFVNRMAALEADSAAAAEQEEQEDASDRATPSQGSSDEGLHHSVEEHPQQLYMMSGALQSEPSGDGGKAAQYVEQIVR